MKVIVNNTNNIVYSAYYDFVNKNCSSLFINTVARWVCPDSISSIWNDDTFDNMYTLEFHFYVESIATPALYDTVLFIAETEKEEEVLGRLRFTLHDKDQLWYALLNSDVYMTTKKET